MSGMLKEKDLIPISPRGQEIKERFYKSHFRKNPHESPMAKALALHGYEVKNYQLQSDDSEDDSLASEVSMKGLKIIFRQPTPQDLVICYIEREGEQQKMFSPLFGIMEFIGFCHYYCQEVHCLGGCVEKIANQGSPRDLKIDRLIQYYHRILGDIEGYAADGFFWIYADMHNKKRFETLPVWKRYQRK